MRTPRLSELDARRRDALIAAAGGCGGLLLLLFAGTAVLPGFPGWSHWFAYPLLLVMVGAESRRSSRPASAAAVGGVALALTLLVSSGLGALLMYTDVLYAAVVYGSRRLAKTLHITLGLVTVLLSGLALVFLSVGQALNTVALCMFVLLMPLWTGELVSGHRGRAESERLRAEQTALLAELDRRDAVTSERARMARELHDVVANHLSAIAIHATGSLSIAKRRTDIAQDDPLLQALGVVRENSVQGLAEMRRMIGLLRSASEVEESQLAAAPRLSGLETLVEQIGAAAGERQLLRLEEDGDPVGLPVPLELAAYRIVQESLTNALKHGAPGEVTARLRYRRDGVEIDVCSPYLVDAGAGLPGARAGLLGMAERVELLGGRFRAGPDPGRHGGWLVHAELPVEPAGEGTR